MIIAFDDDATVYSPTLTIYGAPTWTWAFSESFLVRKVIELTLALYARAASINLYDRNLIADLSSRTLSLKTRTKP